MTTREYFRHLRAVWEATGPEHQQSTLNVLVECIQRQTEVTGGGAEMIDCYMLDGIPYLGIPKDQLGQRRVETLEDLDLDVRVAFQSAVRAFLFNEDPLDELNEAIVGRILDAVADVQAGGTAFLEANTGLTKPN